MSKVLDATNPEVVQAVEVIAKGLPGWGSAFRDLRKLSGLSQAAVAKALDLNDTAVSHWEAQRHRAAPAVLRNALIAIRVDARLVHEHFGGVLPGVDALGAHTNPKEAALKVAELILSLPDADPDELEALLHEKLDLQIVAGQAAKALAGDTRAASFFLQRGDATRQRRRKRNYVPQTASSEILDVWTPQRTEPPEPPVAHIRAST